MAGLWTSSVSVTSMNAAVGQFWRRCCAQRATRSSSSMRTVMASVPRPTVMPRRAMATRSAMPTALFRLDCGLWATMVCVSASRSSSASSTWTQWAQMVPAPSSP